MSSSIAAETSSGAGIQGSNDSPHIFPTRTSASSKLVADISVVTDASPASYAVTNVNAVTPRGLVDGATVVVENGIIVDVGRVASPPKAFDGRGLLLIPGIVDTHSDALEKELRPRSSALFDTGFAVRSLEAKAAGAGITTMFHGLGFEESQDGDRTVAQAVDMTSALLARGQDGTARIDHRLLFRMEARRVAGHHEADVWIEKCKLLHGIAPIVSFEDHTPGQGQYGNLDKYRYALRDAFADEEELEAHVKHVVAEAVATNPVRDATLARLSGLARRGAARLLVHDPDGVEAIEAAVAAGATVAEFPVSVTAAQAARDAGLLIVMGGPNVVRGRSHSGNVSAEELVRAGICDAIASDYQPTTLLASIGELVQRGACDLVQAVALVTSGPAAVVGLSDRGRLEPGCRGDVLLTGLDNGWMSVVRTWRAVGR